MVSADFTQGTFTIGKHVVAGSVAEILCVLDTSAAFKQVLDDAGLTLEALAAALDTNYPAEDRINKAEASIGALRLSTIVGDWLPGYGRIAEHEYHLEFYSAHRDHAIHTLQVYLLGWYLFETVTPLRDRLSARLATLAPSIRFNGADRFRIWWTIASLYHDQGYPFEAEQFIPDETFRSRTLKAISDELNKDAFLRAFLHKDVPDTPENRRAILRAGRFVPLEIPHIELLLDSSGAAAEGSPHLVSDRNDSAFHEALFSRDAPV